MIVFEHLNPENVKIVLELNNYGNTPRRDATCIRR
jgi:hypothetical protein